MARAPDWARASAAAAGGAALLGRILQRGGRAWRHISSRMLLCSGGRCTSSRANSRITVLFEQLGRASLMPVPAERSRVQRFALPPYASRLNQYQGNLAGRQSARRSQPRGSQPESRHQSVAPHERQSAGKPQPRQQKGAFPGAWDAPRAAQRAASAAAARSDASA